MNKVRERQRVCVQEEEGRNSLVSVINRVQLSERRREKALLQSAAADRSCSFPDWESVCVNEKESVCVNKKERKGAAGIFLK